MTKAATIFNNIRKDAQYIVRTWGVEESKAKDFACKFNLDGTDGRISQRTVNDVQKHLNKYHNDVRKNYTYGVINDEQLLREVEIVRLLRSAIYDGQKLVDELKAL